MRSIHDIYKYQLFSVIYQLYQKNIWQMIKLYACITTKSHCTCSSKYFLTYFHYLDGILKHKTHFSQQMNFNQFFKATSWYLSLRYLFEQLISILNVCCRCYFSRLSPFVIDTTDYEANFVYWSYQAFRFQVLCTSIKNIILFVLGHAIIKFFITSLCHFIQSIYLIFSKSFKELHLLALFSNWIENWLFL